MISHTESDKKETGKKTFSGQDTRQGEIILKAPWQRWIFIAGLVGMIVFLALTALGVAK